MPFDQWKNLELPYDYRSVMHFGSRQLSQHGTMSMVKKDGTEIIPNKLRPTSLDIAKICAAYECSEACGNRWATCNNGEPLFVHRRCDGWLDCEDESDEEGCTGKLRIFIISPSYWFSYDIIIYKYIQIIF